MSFYKQCKWCGNEMLAIRDSKIYCSDSCKTMACRARRKKEQKAAFNRAQFENLQRKQDEFYKQMDAKFEDFKAKFNTK